jgi:hypothetical protein
MTQREERGRLRGPNAVADDTTRGGSDNARHVPCDGLPPYMIDIILDNSMPLFILQLKIITTSTSVELLFVVPVQHVVPDITIKY